MEIILPLIVVILTLLIGCAWLLTRLRHIEQQLDEQRTKLGRQTRAEARQRQISESLRQVALILSSSLDQAQVISKILAQLGRVIQYDGFGLFLKEGSELVLVSGSSLSEKDFGLRLSLSDPPERLDLAAQVFLTGQPMMLDDVRHHPNYEATWAGNPDIRGWMSVPMMMGAQVLGVINVDSFRVGAYDADDLEVVMLFANQATIAIQNARLFADMRREKQLFETILQSSPVAIVTTDLQQQIVSWNPAAEQLFGYRAIEVIGQNIDQVVASNSHYTEAIGITETTLNGQPTHLLTQRPRKDGSLVDVALFAVPVMDEDKRPIMLLVMYHDVTAIKRVETDLRQRNMDLATTLLKLKSTQDELVQSEKLAALGQLLAGVAHEINTPLGAIRAAVGNIGQTLDESIQQLPQILVQLSTDKQRLFFSLIEQAISQRQYLSSKEVRQLRRKLRRTLEAASYEQAAAYADVLTDMGITGDVSVYLPLLDEPNSLPILDVAYKLVRQRNNSENITIAVEKAARMVTALKNYTHFDQSGEKVQTNIPETIETVLMLYHNQLKHGVEVVQQYEADVPTIQGYPDELNQVWTNLIHNALQAMNSQGQLTIGIGRQAMDGDGVLVSITDDGPGIPDDIQAKIFEPFFTTKPTGEGSGLGLDICQNIVTKHNGQITVASQPGETTFHVWLPVEKP